MVTPVSSGVVWHLGALEWGWFLNALAELRLVAEPQALAGFAKQNQLESAVPVLQRFLQDVGLWVVVD